MAYVDFDGVAAVDARDPTEELDETFLREYCPRVTTAMDRVTNNRF